MANVTDPLVNQLSGSDPQNLLEYITRQKIYDSRYWKEECFGLTVADVLEKCTHIETMGTFPCHCLALTLKLLQLHPEHELIRTAFVEQTEFKYARAIGCLYIRMTSRPVEIYETLEPIYADYRKLRVWQSPEWSLITMDQFIHQLLSQKTNTGNCLGIALPRLPVRRALQEAGYLPEGPRPTALQATLEEHAVGDSSPEATFLNYLRHKAVVEKCPAAIVAWERRKEKNDDDDDDDDQEDTKPTTSKRSREANDSPSSEEEDERKDEHKKRKKKKKKERNYDNLFKQKSGDKSKHASAVAKSSNSAAAPEEGSEEYWNEQRAKLGLSQLK